MPRPVAVGLAAAVLVAGQVSIAAGAYMPFLSPLVGFGACFIVPLFLVYQLLGRRSWFLGAERMAVAVAGTLLALMVTGLAADVVLPVFGVTRPLDTWPVIGACDLLNVGLAAVAYRWMPERIGPGRLLPTGWRGRLCAGLAVLTVPLAAMGAVRLNNGAGSGMTLVDLGLVIVVMALVLRWRDLMDSGVTALVIYSIALALLFMTSLRGWYTTGHDVQQEMLSFLRTSQAGRWTGTFHDGYNSCLSITILPTVVLRWTQVADPYVFKVFFQTFYAICPVAVYYLGRRITSDSMSLISTFFFVGFVGYLQDMPMLNRQEVAFIFFSTALLVLFMSERPRRWRWTAFCVLGTGMVLAHYSTTYFAIGALGAALLLRLMAVQIGPRYVTWWRDRVEERPPSGLIGWRLLAFLAVLATIWNGPVNHSGGALFSQVSHAVQGALGGSQTRAADVGYSLAGPGRGTTQAKAFSDLMAAEAAVRTKHPQYFDPSPPPSANLTPLLPAGKLPVTPLGRQLTGSPQAATALNRAWRTAAAWGLQLLLAIGLVVVLFRRRYAASFSTDAVFLGLAMVSLLVVQVALPSISLDYGVGRSFMQALMVLGPFMAIGAAALAGWLVPRWRTGMAFGLAGVIFASTSGLVPQLTGGYPAQLHLNNSGDYYDRFYLQAQDVAGVQWLKSSVVERSSRYPDIQADTDLFDDSRSLGGIRAYDDIYPSDIRKDAFVVLSGTNVKSGKVLEVVDGYELWLQYPTDVLDHDKSLIYDNGGTQIYR
jgi:uncharacterized membrane protein